MIIFFSFFVWFGLHICAAFILLGYSLLIIRLLSSFFFFILPLPTLVRFASPLSLCLRQLFFPLLGASLFIALNRLVSFHITKHIYLMQVRLCKQWLGFRAFSSAISPTQIALIELTTKWFLKRHCKAIHFNLFLHFIGIDWVQLFKIEHYICEVSGLFVDICNVTGFTSCDRWF